MNNIKETIGCDLGDKKSTIFVLGNNGKGQRAAAIATTQGGFTKFFKAREAAHVVIETGTHSRWVCELLQGFGHEVTVANSYRLSLISQNHKKSDDADAELLARMGRSDVGLLSPVIHRSKQCQVDLAMIKMRRGTSGPNAGRC